MTKFVQRIQEQGRVADSDDRQEQILSAATAVIVRLGYDKTTMSDIAAEAGVSRGTVYLYFKSKEDLFEALVYWEWMQYAQTWLSYMEADPRGGTMGGVYRATFSAMNAYPLIASMMSRDRHVLGNYLRKKDNLFAWMQSGSTMAHYLRLLQEAGTVRQDVDPVVMGHIIDMLSYGQMTIDEIKPPDQSPPFDVVIETLADMMDRFLTPETGGNSEAGKAVIRQVVAGIKAQLEQIKQLKDARQASSKGTTHDNS